MEAIRELALTIFGSGDGDLTVWQMSFRALVVYPFLLFLVRVGDKRFLGEISAFDFVLAIVIGSISSRAISGNAAFWPSLAASILLVGLHWVGGLLAFRYDRVAGWVKGWPRTLVEDGKMDLDQMRKAAIGEHDLESALRRRADGIDLEDAALMCLERNGEISVVPKKR